MRPLFFLSLLSHPLSNILVVKTIYTQGKRIMQRYTSSRTLSNVILSRALFTKKYPLKPMCCWARTKQGVVDESGPRTVASHCNGNSFPSRLPSYRSMSQKNQAYRVVGAIQKRKRRLRRESNPREESMPISSFMIVISQHPPFHACQIHAFYTT
ncbi:hypothetical protein QBC37DRAFT_81973 [Rhypophila decipiens]|uniref:Secreted protein n=1 Tax=Rhypophila decipiens TaxID=261697 RepID=A0AAN7B2R8_9PEZI|nr:hypothetical protein QBC37DRAFT_81973 [Rhypophila decipiens]